MANLKLTQAGKLIYFGTCPNWVVSYIAYTKFHSPRPVFHSPGQIFTRNGGWASASFLACNSSPPGQNGRHFTDDIFRCIFMNENVCILIIISLEFVPKGLIDNLSALVQVMAWRLTCDKPLPEQMIIQFTDAYMRHSGEMSYHLKCHWNETSWCL